MGLSGKKFKTRCGEPILDFVVVDLGLFDLIMAYYIYMAPHYAF